jgi:quercetin dioxygenase-like cupin family protein
MTAVQQAPGALAHGSSAARSQRPEARKVIQNRVEIDPEVPLVRHWHPGEEIIHVFEGSLEYQIDGSRRRPTKPAKP